MSDVPEPGVRVGRIAAAIGFALASVLVVWLMVVQLSRSLSNVGFAVVYGLLLVAPFGAALFVRNERGARRPATWVATGLIAAAVAMTSLSVAVLPLIMPASLLVFAGVRGLLSARARAV